ncbi:MAG: Altered inheritance of mitochondria protein 18 mitochondrial [Vezdaea aestivalis]|nr:MAG: Altered inheritance of mitochondria protein 18 mitochondrial [Vezdaea aestivalis]
MPARSPLPLLRPLRRQYARPLSLPRLHRAIHLSLRPSLPLKRFVRSNVHLSHSPESAREEQSKGFKRRMKLYILGLTVTSIAMIININFFHPGLDTKAGESSSKTLNDALPSSPMAGSPGLSDPETVQTGDSIIPTIPKHLIHNKAEYLLLGHGVRTVSFLRIRVYHVGIYVAVEDIPRLQHLLIGQTVPDSLEGLATSLVKPEKDALRRLLLDPLKGEGAWDQILKAEGVKSVVRVVPVRSTDWGHLRDGWIRAVGNRGKGEGFEDDEFGEAVGAFKKVFGKGGVGKGRGVRLARGRAGDLKVWLEEEAQEEEEGKEKERGHGDCLGEVRDERIARLIWLGYLAGKNVACEDARTSVVEGVMELVERPVGTVEAQVV